MLSTLFSSTRRLGIKPGRSVRAMMQIGLAMLALAIAASPAVSAGARPLALANSGVGNSAGGEKAPNAVCPGDGQCFADVPPSSGFYTFTNRIYMQDLVSGYACGGPGEPCDSENRPYYRPGSSVTRQQMAKFIDNARRMSQIEIEVEGGTAPIEVMNNTGPAIQGGSVSSIGVHGHSDVGWGVLGTSDSSNGVYGGSTSGYGVNGVSTSGVGVRGTSTTTNGVQGVSTSGYGLQGTTATGPAAINGWNQGTGYGVEGRSDSAQGIAVYGYSDNGNGAEGRSINGKGVRGYSANNKGVEGVSTSNSGVYGISTSGWGVYGESNGDSADAGVTGGATNARGVYGSSTNSFGVYAESYASIGLYAVSSQTWAGYFAGDVWVTGSCTGCYGPSKVDHPLDPENKYLYQSPVQSDEMTNVYNGNATTDDKGLATVQLPTYFEALNRDFRYQLTAIGQFADAIVWQEVANNSFVIKTDKPNVKVSWQVTGIRNDPYANANRVAAEEDKPADEQGTYLHPTAWGQPESKGIDYEARQRVEQAAQERK